MSEKRKLGVILVALAFLIGIGVGAVIFSTHTTNTNTVTKWKNPDNQVIKYTIQDIHSKALYKEDGKLVNISDFGGIEYQDKTQRYKGGSVLVKNGISEVETFGYGFDELSIESVELKVQIYQSGQVIDEYTTSCGIYDKYDGEYMEFYKIKPDVYDECFDVQLEGNK